MNSLPVRNVLMSLKIPVLFCEAKVNDIYLCLRGGLLRRDNNGLFLNMEF